jgi:phenylalanyl-tRNA synthetase alpha chain
MMKTQILTIQQEALTAIDKANDLILLGELKNTYLAKKSVLMGLYGQMKSLTTEEKADIGLVLNRAKEAISTAIETKLKALEEASLIQKLNDEKVDVTLPGRRIEQGSINPFFLIEEEISDIFLSLGYQIKEGPEVETDQFNFELLNIPKDHPAREMQDSLYINESTLLRTHTSPVQARIMQEAQGRPIQIICPGKVYRKDEDDATHSHQFGQIEGLVVAQGIHLGHLQATLQLFAKKMFGEKREIRLRPSFFPFTEPSVEVDVSCFECGGKGCNLCKHSGWIEILGGGMVNPSVLTMNGYDPNNFSGFAFGIGIERVAMLRYGIDDIRRFYQNDMRFISQFNKR